MRALVLLIISCSLAAQPAWGWQRVVCRDGSPCPPASAKAEAACCPPAPCDSQPATPASPCMLSASASHDATPAAPGVEVRKPVFLAIAIVPTVLPELNPRRAEERQRAHRPPPVPRASHAARAPPLA